MGDLQRFLNGAVVVKTGDITREDVDAIVNAANHSLMGGGGVDGAIHRAGGPDILDDCKEIRRTRFPQGLPTGQAVMTRGGKLPAKYVIHTVGPVYSHRVAEKAKELAACYQNSLRLAAERGLRSVAFPAISTGVYGYPMDEAARVSSSAVEAFLKVTTSVEEIRMVFFSPQDAEVFLSRHAFSA